MPHRFRLLPHGMRGMLLVLLLSMLGPLLIVQLALYVRWTHARYRTEEQSNLELARAVASNFRSYVMDLVRQEVALARALDPLKARAPTAANELLASTANIYTTVRAFSWADLTGRIIASSDLDLVGRSIEDPFLRGLLPLASQPCTDLEDPCNWTVSDLAFNRKGQPCFYIARIDRTQEGQAEGLVIAELDPTQLGAFAINIERAERGRIALFDRAGTLVYIRPEVEIDKTLRREWADQDALLREALGGREARGTFISPAEEEPRIAARVPIQPWGWVAGAARPQSEVTAVARRDQAVAVAAVLATVLASALCAGIISRQITNPVRLLRSQAEAIGHEQFAPQNDVKGIIELEHLSETFNQMAQQLQERKAAVERATNELVRSNAELESFSYSVSHDLRSPLRAIDGFSRVIEDDYAPRLDDEGRRLIGLIRANTRKMGQLIDNLLTFSRLGRQAMTQARIDMTDLVHSVWQDVRTSLGDRLIQFTTAPLPAAAGDATMVRQAVRNLIDNAVKFTGPKPRAVIEISGRIEDDQCVYSVRDNGVGFDMAYVTKLFGVFQRLHRAEEFEGTGVGLALVQRIIQRHGGRVWAEGAVDHGATFYFTLPKAN